MITAGFLRQKIEKIYEYTVEECEELHISQYLAYLYECEAFSGSPNQRPFPNFPNLETAQISGGIFEKIAFVCPGCGHPRMSLFLAPDDPDVFNYRCRMCIGLVYSSQRYGQRHPLRNILTHRKKVSLKKEMMCGRSTNNGPQKSRRKPWENPALLVQAKEFLPKLDGLAGEAFSRILEIAENGKNKKMQDKAKRLLKRYVSRLKQIEKQSEAAKIVVIRA